MDRPKRDFRYNIRRLEESQDPLFLECLNNQKEYSLAKQEYDAQSLRRKNNVIALHEIKKLNFPDIAHIFQVTSQFAADLYKRTKKGGDTA